MTELKPSKSALKREDKERQALGLRLLDVDASALRAMNLDTSLLDAVIAAKAMSSHGALRRQKQLIGKLMRSADVASIQAALDAQTADATREKREFRQAESWRDRLLENPSGGLAELKAIAGDTSETERILANLASARDDREQKRLQRELFRALRKALASTE